MIEFKKFGRTVMATMSAKLFGYTFYGGVTLVKRACHILVSREGHHDVVFGLTVDNIGPAKYLCFSIGPVAVTIGIPVSDAAVEKYMADAEKRFKAMLGLPEDFDLSDLGQKEPALLPEAPTSQTEA